MELQSFIDIYGDNREIIGLGFHDPELFKILNDAKGTEPEKERRYLQIWLNQIIVIDARLRASQDESVITAELKDGLKREIADFFAMENMREHWRKRGSFYPASFQKFIK